MTRHNADNERLKRRYFAYLKEAKRYSDSSVDAVAAAIYRFECFTRFREFKAFHIEQAIAFKNDLANTTNSRSGESLSKSTLYATLNALRGFFVWLAGQPGFRSHLSYSDAEYFNLSQKDSRVAKARREVSFPSLEQITHVLDRMPDGSSIERRNRALIAFAILTGARDSAIASCRLGHVDVEQKKFAQDARNVATKFSKTIMTSFFPVGGASFRIVADWIAFLRTELLWAASDPLFPATEVIPGPNKHFQVTGLRRAGWASAAPIREIFKSAFSAAGLPYFHPHSFRHTLVQLGERVCRDPEEFKAWSQNLGHEHVSTTFSSYGAVAPARQAEILERLRTRQTRGSGTDITGVLEAALAAARNAEATTEN